MNKYIKNGVVYKKSFSGVSPKELTHYCTHTLMIDKPDACIFNVGTNRLKKDEPVEIYEDIMNIVKLCNSYGVSNIYISSIVYRPRYLKQVSDINKLLRKNNLQ